MNYPPYYPYKSEFKSINIKQKLQVKECTSISSECQVKVKTWESLLHALPSLWSQIGLSGTHTILTLYKF